jgi:hypothetical protein
MIWDSLQRASCRYAKLDVAALSKNNRGGVQLLSSKIQQQKSPQKEKYLNGKLGE